MPSYIYKLSDKVKQFRTSRPEVFVIAIAGNSMIVCDGVEAVAQTCSVKKVFLEISRNCQENTCARVSILIKLQTWALQLC